MKKTGSFVTVIKNTEQKRRNKLIVLIILTVAVTAFIWNNSTASIEESKSLSTGIMGVIKSFLDPMDKIDNDIFHVFIRKAAHFTEFFVLGMLYLLISKNSGRYSDKVLFLPPFATLFTAVCDEFIQFFTGRGTDVRDVMLDFAGAVCGITIAWLITNFIEKQKNE